ncbi:MAG TPA: glycerol-3-phosphate dehydrogenase, partial [Arenimonas sp.]|nr:glycerol-3-phosphate dehydrogenase [Arenimonas sp.]
MSEAIKIAVLGAGSWGTALASLTARHAYPTLIWGRNVEQIKAINEQHENTRYLPGIPLPESLHASSDLPKVVA